MPPSAPAQEELRHLPHSLSHPQWKPARVVWSGQKDANRTERLLNPPARTEEVRIKRALNKPDQIGYHPTDPRVSCGDSGVTPGEADLADYTRSIERLNTSLGFLQTEMQRLAQQQEKIMAMREQQQQQQAWVIPAPAPSPHRYVTF